MNETTPKISVIVPVYKAENYLHRCVDSLLAQTFQDFEILLVDDGSPDCSGEICDEYARKDKRVRVFHKENGGVSSARQCGMDNAQGEYTIHADPDDWVEPTMLEELYGKAKEEDADMVICDYYVEEKRKTKYVVQKPSALDHETVLCELFQQLHGSCWNKLVKRACYKKYGVQFPLELSYCEDLYVNVCLLVNCINISYLHKSFYHYDQIINPFSLVHACPTSLLYQEKSVCKMLHLVMPQYYFDKVYPYLLWKQARICLICGKPYTVKFVEEFGLLRSSIVKLRIGRRNKFVLLMAFIISPDICHAIYKMRDIFI